MKDTMSAETHVYFPPSEPCKVLLCHRDESHYDFLYQLLQERPREACITHREMPTKEQHYDHLKKHQHAGNSFIIFNQSGDMVGHIERDYENAVHIAIAKRYQGRGYATAAIDLLFRIHPVDRCGRSPMARIAPGNQVSKRLFAKSGFRLSHEVWVKDH